MNTSHPEALNHPASAKRYDMLAPIGNGTESTVYRAYDSVRNEHVALKRFKPGYDLHAQEGCFKTLSTMTHPNLIRLYDLGEDPLGQFMTMQLLKGENLLQKLQRKNLQLPEFFQIAHQVLDGLQAMHMARLLHLELQPANIMVSTPTSGQCHLKLIGFNLCQKIDRERLTTQITELGTGNGSIYFMSPEQLSQQAVDERSDIYSLGCLFYLLLTQRHPFQGTPTRIIMDHLEGRVMHLSLINSELPEWIHTLVMSMIDSQPDQRPQSVREIIDYFSQHQLVLEEAAAEDLIAEGEISDHSPKHSSVPLFKKVI